MTLDKLTMRFQKHRNRTIEFSPHVTTLIGPNESGKSTILRAIKWTFLNRPSVKTLKNWDAEDVRCLLEVDGKKIVRKNGKGANCYLLNGKKFKALRIGVVPEDISKLLNVSDLNFQNQIDGPFWFALTPSQVGKEINQIVNLGSIDSSLKYISAEVRRAKVEKSIIGERIKDLSAKKKELSWTKMADEEFKIIEDKIAQVESIDSRIEELAAAIAAVRSTDKAHQEAKIKVLELSKIGKMLATLNTIESDCEELESTIEELSSCQDIPVEDLDEISTLISRLETNHKNTEELESLLERIESLETKSCQLESEAEEIEGGLHQSLIGQKCPVCGKLISELR